MTSIIAVLLPTGLVSVDRATINDNFAKRHSQDVTVVTAAMSPYTPTTLDQFLEVDASAGAVTILLDTAANFVNRTLIVFAKSVAGGNITIDGAGAETINGAATKVLTVQYSVWKLLSNGTVWWAF